MSLRSLYYSMFNKANKFTHHLNLKKSDQLSQTKLCFMLGSFNVDYKRKTQFFARYRSFVFNSFLWPSLGIKKRDALNDHRKRINESMVFSQKDVYVETWNSCLLEEKITLKRKEDFINMLKVYTREMKNGLSLLNFFS